MCVLCMFSVDWELGGQKKLQGRDFFSIKGLQETNNFFFRPDEEDCGDVDDDGFDVTVTIMMVTTLIMMLVVKMIILMTMMLIVKMIILMIMTLTIMMIIFESYRIC